MKIENSRINEMQWRMVNHEAIKEFDTSSLPAFDGCSEGLEFEDNIESVTKHVILLFQGDSEVSLGYIAIDKDAHMPYEDKFFCEIDGIGDAALDQLIAWMPTPSTHTVER